MKPIIRWNIGVVSNLGRDCLLRSWRNMRVLYGDQVNYMVCYNTLTRLPPELVEMRVAGVTLRAVTYAMEMWVCDKFRDRAAEREQKSGWMFSPLQNDARRRELILDNDVLLFKRHPDIDRFLFGPDSHWLFMEFMYKEKAGDQSQFCYGALESLVSPDLPKIDGGIMGVPEGCQLVLVQTLMLNAGLTPKLLSEFGWGWEQVVMSLLYDEVRANAVLMSHTVVPRVLRWTDFELFADSAGVHLSGINQLKRKLRWSYKTYPDFVSRFDLEKDEANNPVERWPSEPCRV